jgi:hypothetical protein
MAARARSDGYKPQLVAMLDRADDETTSIVDGHAELFDRIAKVNYGDPAQTRNAAVSLASADFVTFLDGDDLWGESWLSHAVAQAKVRPDSIWHPEWRYHFTDEDFRRHSVTRLPSIDAGSYFVQHVASDDPDFDPRVLLLENVWSVNCLASVKIFQQIPYPSTNRGRGLGIEDWSWNIATVCEGYEHRLVPDTVHMIRTKSSGSQNTLNLDQGLLPILPENAWSKLKEIRAKKPRPHN